MEIIVNPRMFQVMPAQLFDQEGKPLPAMALQFVDVMGTMVRVMFALDDWENFQSAVADHEDFAAQMNARSKIIKPGQGSMSPTIRKH